jgi:hypothetical protein
MPLRSLPLNHLRLEEPQESIDNTKERAVAQIAFFVSIWPIFAAAPMAIVLDVALSVHQSAANGGKPRHKAKAKISEFYE